MERWLEVGEAQLVYAEWAAGLLQRMVDEKTDQAEPELIYVSTAIDQCGLRDI